VGGVEYQILQGYEHSFGGREAQLDLGGTVYLAAGLAFGF
jgi:hypothetical protein